MTDVFGTLGCLLCVLLTMFYGALLMHPVPLNSEVLNWLCAVEAAWATAIAFTDLKLKRVLK